MKKTSKILAVVLVAVLAVAALAIFAACGESGEFTGECKYESYGHTYGAKVDVVVKGGKIADVKLYTDAETGWVRTSSPASTWTQADHDKVEAAYEGWIKENIVGQKVKTVLGWEATATAAGQSVGEDVPFITGGTQSSARVIVAVQDALCKLESVSKVTGEVKYDSYGHTYGAKVDVIVMSGKILNVRLYSDKETGWVRTSGPASTWTQENHDNTEAAYAGFIANEIVGQKVKTVLGWEATATASGQSVADGPVITGATQSSARIIVAVQDALAKLK